MKNLILLTAALLLCSCNVLHGKSHVVGTVKAVEYKGHFHKTFEAGILMAADEVMEPTELHVSVANDNPEVADDLYYALQTRALVELECDIINFSPPWSQDSRYRVTKVNFLKGVSDHGDGQTVQTDHE